MRVRGGIAAFAAVLGAVAFVAATDDDDRRPPRVAVASLTPVDYPRQEVRPERERPPKRSDDLAWPLRGTVTGSFSEPRGGRTHDGIDIPIAAGTPIKAAAAGKVVMREEQDGYGNYTCVAHATISTCYAHQSRFRTELGAMVERGEVIGEVGDTGTASAMHLHFEVRRGTEPWGAVANPMKFLPR